MGRAALERTMIEQLAVSRGSSVQDVREELAEGGGVIDSLEGLELAVYAEQFFGFKISDDDLGSGICRSLPELCAFVESKLSASLAQ